MQRLVSRKRTAVDEELPQNRAKPHFTISTLARKAVHPAATCCDPSERRKQVLWLVEHSVSSQSVLFMLSRLPRALLHVKAVITSNTWPLS